VINLVHSHNLTKIDFKDKKAFTKDLMKYFGNVVTKWTRDQAELLEVEEGKLKPDAFAKKVATAYDECEDDETKEKCDALKEKITKFKARGKKILAWVTENIEKNFSECEFYIPGDAEYGNCAILIARYVGEALAPTFYLFMDCVEQQKQ